MLVQIMCRFALGPLCDTPVVFFAHSGLALHKGLRPVAGAQAGGDGDQTGRPSMDPGAPSPAALAVFKVPGLFVTTEPC